ncbi:MAG: 2-C-methyl-D-erythritol 4-phosphate cytidylyltransferase [Mycobacterium sp.]|nr:2-C-methyl-D-erythritol 4-phosphate cytidylyltransferase [Mycobacterium sp.]
MTLSAIVTVPADLEPADFTAPISGVPALVRAVRAVLEVAPVWVVVAETVRRAAAECLASHGLADVPVVAVPNGRPWPANGEKACGNLPFAADQILLHDVRYPLATADLAARVAAGLAQWDVVLPVLPMTDSVKTIAAHDVVLGNVDRSELVTAQYPRGYAAAALIRLQRAGADDLAVLTDPELRVGTVEGEPNAFAVDLARDRTLLAAIVTAD